ncbi:MAG: hypothetical protein ABI556_11650 [Gemmatimonadales bacterium]
MQIRNPLHQIASAALIACATSVIACSDTSGPGVAVSLSLYSVDGVVIPVQLRTTGGKLVTLANGELQGTNWGHACGAAFRLAEGPITAVDVPSCRLRPGDELKTTITLADSRFPAGAHEYRFVP